MDSGRLEAVPPGTGHLDTVRALHQTVVSLRTALEVSKNELKELKQRYQEHSHCLEYADVIEKLTLENHILRRKIIDSGQEERDTNAQNIKLQVTYSPRQHVDDLTSEVIIRTATTEARNTPEALEADTEQSDAVCSTDRLNKIYEETEFESPVNVTEEINTRSQTEELNTPNQAEEVINTPSEAEEVTNTTEEPLSQVISYGEEPQSSFKTKLELLSKFDVRIKVRTLNEGSVISSTTSETDSTSEERKDKKKDPNSFQFEEKRQHFENTEDSKTKISLKSVSSENIKMAVPNEADVKSKADKFDVQVRITSEENLVVKENVERSRRKDTLNLDVDDLSLRSMSEGDNSVFSEGGITPVDPNTMTAPDEKEENASGNESEEVDDIELIFTTDESKDMSNLQEDLVSIRDTDQWGPPSASTHSTPVLIKFHTLDPDFQPRESNENQENTQNSLRMKRVSLPSDKDIRHVAFNGKSLDLPRGILKSCDNKSDNMLYKRSPNTSTRRLDSVDSLTCEYNRGLSFDNTKSSSFELGSSMDMLQREESMDSFRMGHLGHRFSVFAETDISKCGISEDDLAASLNVRRNTCPNPFQYRLSQYRVSRPPGPFKAPPGRRPVRESTAPRRESGAQTDMTALPPRWSSDGYLAYQTCAPTLPTRATSRRLTAPDARPPRTDDEARRVMLSDIGFTSMVPELSRSADPVWALAKRPSQTDSSPLSTSTSKFLSRGSSYRSPCLSIDRSNDWTPQTVYVPLSKDRPWRCSLPDVRRDDTADLLDEADAFVRRSIDNLRSTSLDLEGSILPVGTPYIPSEPKQLRLGHAVKVIAPYGRIAVGRVRYVGIAGGSAAAGGVCVGCELRHAAGARPHARNDGTHKGRRYFLAQPGTTALFVPFSKVVMAWAN